MSTRSASETAARSQQVLGWLALIVVGVYLLVPILTPAHIEGFSASMVSIGVHLRNGDVGAYDRLHPLSLEYFALSRFGANLLIAAFLALFPVTPERALQLQMWLGAVLLGAASFALVRRWANGGVPAALAVVALLLDGMKRRTGRPRSRGGTLAPQVPEERTERGHRPAGRAAHVEASRHGEHRARSAQACTSARASSACSPRTAR